MSLDIFNPTLSVVAEGLEGKKILLYGSNNLGKTYQASRMKKPYFISFEKGLSARDGIPFASINKWSDFTKVVKQFEKNATKAKEMYQTIIIDGADIMAKYCSKYVCSTYDVTRIKDGNDGFGLWTEFETELWEQVDKLVSLDFTIVFITHVEYDKKGKAFPKGDKRLMPTIRDNSDFTVYLETNGMNEEGDVVNSSAYLAETDEFFARSRFTYVANFIEEFTAESLEETINEGIKLQREKEGIKTVDYQTQKESLASEKLNYDELMEGIKQAGKEMMAAEKTEELQEIVEKYLGKGKKVTDCKKTQVEVMSVILDELKEVLNEEE